MSIVNKYNYIFIIFVFIASIILFFTANTLDISYDESLIYFNNSSILNILTNISTYIFGKSNIALRLPFVLSYIISSVLFYKISKIYIKKNRDQLISVLIFISLPGLISSALLVNISILVILFTLLYIYLYNKTNKHSYFLLVLFLILDNSFAILFISLFFYSLRQKDNYLLVVSLALFGISMQVYGFDTGGKPKGFFIDTIAIYMSIFSPLIFFYFVYSLYKSALNDSLDLLWYIATTTLVFSLLLSFRQNINIEEFAPFVVIAIPIMVKIFLNSYRVRLPQFRNKHKLWLNITIIVLLINSIVLIYNKPLYLYFEYPSKHFAYKYHFTSLIASKLHNLNISHINIIDKQLASKLKFYGIYDGSDYTLVKEKPKNIYKIINIDYLDKEISKFYIIKN